MALRPMARSSPASASSAVARDRNARDDEAAPVRLERECRGRRHAVEGVLPGGRCARDQHHAVADRDHAGGADAERRIADLECCWPHAERGRARPARWQHRS